MLKDNVDLVLSLFGGLNITSDSPHRITYLFIPLLSAIPPPLHSVSFNLYL